MGQTSKFKIPYPDPATTFAPLNVHFANLAEAVDRELGNVAAGAARIGANSFDRSAIFPNPVQGNQINRIDRGYTEQYFSTYNSGSNAFGASPAGWYPVAGTLPEIFLPIIATKGYGDNGGELKEIFSTPKVTPGASDYFTINADKVITITQPCEVTVEYRIAVSGLEVDTKGTAKFFCLKNSTNFSITPPAPNIVGESEVIMMGGYRQWMNGSLPHIALSTGDTLRFGAFSNSNGTGGTAFGNPIGAVTPATFARVVCTGPRRG